MTYNYIIRYKILKCYRSSIILIEGNPECLQSTNETVCTKSRFVDNSYILSCGDQLQNKLLSTVLALFYYFLHCVLDSPQKYHRSIGMPNCFSTSLYRQGWMPEFHTTRKNKFINMENNYFWDKNSGLKTFHWKFIFIVGTKFQFLK